jgi:hypothetical protein
MLRSQIILLLLAMITASCTTHAAGSPTVSPSAPSEPTLLSIESTEPSATPQPYQISISPNGMYVANMYPSFDVPSGKDTIEIRDDSGKLIQEVLYQGEPPISQRPLLSIFQWSHDSAYLYFCYVLLPDGGSMQVWWTGFDLQSLEISTGEIKPLLSTQDFAAFEISPDGKELAYADNAESPTLIHIRDLSTGAERSVEIMNGPTKFSAVGDLHWSPSGSGIVFQTQDSNYNIQTIYLDVRSMRQNLIKEYTVYGFDFHGWVGDGKIEFKKVQSENEYVEHIDVATGEVTVVGTVTPSP